MLNRSLGMNYFLIHPLHSLEHSRIMFEIDGVPQEVALEALRLGAQKMPVMTKTVVRADYAG